MKNTVKMIELIAQEDYDRFIWIERDYSGNIIGLNSMYGLEEDSKKQVQKNNEFLLKFYRQSKQLDSHRGLTEIENIIKAMDLFIHFNEFLDKNKM